MLNLTCHICGADQLFDLLRTAERAGWRWSTGGWRCPSCSHVVIEEGYES